VGKQGRDAELPQLKRTDHPHVSSAHVINDVVQAVPHGAGQHVHLAGAAVGSIQLHALDNARQEAVGVADPAAGGGRGTKGGGGKSVSQYRGKVLVMLPVWEH
jgi:hypothetical protein